MSADDQAFLDILSSVPNDIKKYSSDVADYVDSHLEKVSSTLRDALSSSKWIPESARPKAPRPPPKTVHNAIAPSLLGRIQCWVGRNKILTTIIVLAIGGVTYQVIKSNYPRKKRRAKRAGNGARLEVIVIAGPPSDPITRSLALDLERRGFIVYIVCHTIEEEVLVQNEARPDIKPLMIDIVDPESAQASIDRFKIHLQTPHFAFQGAKPHHLSLRALILNPSSNYPISPIATLSPSTISDLLNTRLVTPTLITQTFLPLLQSLPLPQHHSPDPSTIKPSILLLTPSIISSLSPAFHGPESIITTSLQTFATVLSSELAPLKIPVTQIHIGSFDTSAYTHNRPQANASAQRAQTLKWDSVTRHAYGRDFVAMAGGMGNGRKGSSLRELNNCVFDAMISGKGGVVRVGIGAALYGFIGAWVPRGLVGWMMGMRNVGTEIYEFGHRSGGGLLEDGKQVVRDEEGGLGESEFVNIYGEGRTTEECEYRDPKA